MSKIVKLKDKTGEKIYPVAGSALENSISANMLSDPVAIVAQDLEETPELDYVTTANIKDGAVTDAKLASDIALLSDQVSIPSETSFISTDNIQDEAVTTAKIADAAVTSDKIANAAVTSDKIDYATYTVPATLYFREGLTASYNIRMIRLSGDIAMAVGTPAGYIVSNATQSFRVNTETPLFSTIYSYSLTGYQVQQAASYLTYAAAQTSKNFIDAYIHCPNTTSAVNVVLSFMVIGKLA